MATKVFKLMLILKTLLFALAVSMPLMLHAENLNMSGVRHISKEEIQQSGLMRLSDLFLLLEDWNVSSHDGLTWQASPLGLNSYQNQEWKIFLNGQPLDIGFWGTIALDRIPVDLGQIDSICVKNQPGIYFGQKSLGGLIDIYTKKHDSKVSINFRTGFGNEIGDPGPYRYTNLYSPNIDKIGNIVGLGFYHGAKNYYHNFIYKREIAYPTDEAVSRRNADIAGTYYPRQILESYFINYGQTSENFNYSISAAWSDFADFFFLSQYGREIPVNSKFRYVAGTGSIGRSESPLITHRFAYSSNRLGRRENSLNLDFDWKQEHIRTNLETYFSKSKFKGTIGIGLNHLLLSSGYQLENTKITEGLLYGQTKYLFSKNINTTFDWALNYRKNKFGFLGQSNIYVQLEKNSLLKTALSYSITLPEESNSIWYWQNQGYTFLEDNGIIYNIDGKLKPFKKFTFDISLANRISRVLSMEFSGYYRAFSQIIYEGQFIISSTDYSAPNNLILKTDCSGQVVGGKIEAKINPFNKFKLRLTGRYQNSIKDEKLFEEVWSTIPKINLSGTIVYTPINNFSLWSRIKFSGPTEWVDYDNDDNILTGEHNSVTVAEAFSVDLSVQKYFQRRKIRASFSIRNLLNRKLTYSPIGAQFDLAYYAQIEFLLN